MQLSASHFYRRNLPHIVNWSRPLFVTFSTMNRTVLPPGARTLTLRHVLFEHGRKISLHVAVVMPDHVHLIFWILGAFELAEVMKGIKGVSARSINRLLGRIGRNVWQDESMDHVVRCNEWGRGKVDYVCNNPVRAGLVSSAEDYPWLWRAWIEGGGAQTGVSVPHL